MANDRFKHSDEDFQHKLDSDPRGRPLIDVLRKPSPIDRVTDAVLDLRYALLEATGQDCLSGLLVTGDGAQWLRDAGFEHAMDQVKLLTQSRGSGS